MGLELIWEINIYELNGQEIVCINVLFIIYFCTLYCTSEKYKTRKYITKHFYCNK